MSRRRLESGRDLPAEKYGWKPFGGADYGYPEFYQLASSWTIWALVTLGSFTVDPYEATALLAGGFYASERDADNPKFGSGSSWIHNLQAGYCWYHYFVKGRRGLALQLGSYGEIVLNSGAILQEKIFKDVDYSHQAHYDGASLGMLLAFLLDMLRPKKGGNTPTWFKAIPFAMIATLLVAVKTKSVP